MNPPSHLIFVGTYTTGASKGIYSVRLDPASGSLSEPALAAAASHPTFLAFSPDKRLLYSIVDSEAWASAFSIEGERLAPLAAPPAAKAVGGCHLAVDRTGRALVVSNYHTAALAALAVRGDGSLGPPQVIRHNGRGTDPVRQAGPHIHSAVISPDNGFVLVCDLGLDRIYVYRLDASNARLSPAQPPYAVSAPRSGPRHSAFAANGARAYVNHELDNTVTAFDFDPATGGLSPIQTISNLPAGFTGKNIAAEIALHPGGNFLYVSNRGHDSIAVFSVAAATGLLSPVEFTPSGGLTPRHFAISPDGAWLVCANQGSGTLQAFRIDRATGRLTPAGRPVPVPDPVCVRFYA